MCELSVANPAGRKREGREIEVNFSEISKAGEWRLTPCPLSPRDVWEMHDVFPAQQPESQALRCCEFIAGEPAPQAGQSWSHKWIVALPRQ